MNDMNKLEQLAPIADEMLSGLHADEMMKRRILTAAREKTAPRRAAVRRFVPALSCAALAIACVGMLGLRLSGAQTQAAEPVAIRSIAAGDHTLDNSVRVADVGSSVRVADVGSSARVKSVAPSENSLFAVADGDIPLVAVNGCVYRMLTAPKNVDSSLVGDAVGSIAAFSDTPSLAEDDAFSSGLSNVSGEGTAIHAVSGLDASTAVAAEVGGKMRLFQRVSYAGRGPGGQGLEDTFSVRGLVTELTLSDVGTLTGDAANDAIAVLLDHAYLKSTDTSSHRQTLTATLSNGLKLQLGVSGDTVSGCGNWSCPEFFEAFKAAL